MPNKLNTLSKNGLITGSAGIILLLAFIVTEGMELHRLIEARADDKDSSKSVLKNCGMIVLYLVGILVCSLFISGIRRRRQWLMLPLLLLGTGGGLFLSGFKIYNATDLNCAHVEIAAVVTCLTVIILYPVWMLFCEIRLENIEEKKQLLQSKLQRV